MDQPVEAPAKRKGPGRPKGSKTKRIQALEPALPVPVEAMRLAHRTLTDKAISKRLRYTPRAIMQAGRPLTDWEYRMAEWWSAVKRLSTKRRRQATFVEVATRARTFQTECKAQDWPAERVFTRDDWRRLQERKEFIEYVELLLNSMQDAAKKKFEDYSVDFVDAHIKGLRLAAENDDYKQIYRYTNPALERIAPVKQQQQISAVQIILSPSQQASLDAQLPVVEAEIIND